MGTFTTEELWERADKLVEDAEKGEISVVTKQGKPLFLAVPVTEPLKEGERLALAIKLYQDEVLRRPHDLLTCPCLRSSTSSAHKAFQSCTIH